MHDKPIGAKDEGAPTVAEDTRDQGRVLHEVLFIYPETVTLEELIRELTGRGVCVDEWPDLISRGDLLRRRGLGQERLSQLIDSLEQ